MTTTRRCSLLVLVALCAAGPASSQERWHEETLPGAAVGERATDMVLVGTAGWIALATGVGQAPRLLQLSLSERTGPFFAEPAFPAGTSAGGDVRVSFNGDLTAVVLDEAPVAVFQGVAGPWSLSPLPLGTWSTFAGSVDVSGGEGLLLAVSDSSGGQPYRVLASPDLAAWHGAALGPFAIDGVLAHLSGGVGLVADQSGALYVLADPFGGDAVQLLGPPAAPLPLEPEAVAAVALGLDGALLSLGPRLVVVLGLDDTPSATPCEVPVRYPRLAVHEGVAFALDDASPDDARLLRVDAPASCAAWQAAGQSTGLTAGGVAVSGDGVVVVTGESAGGVPSLRWRNRPPYLVSAPAPLELAAGGSAVAAIDAIDPDPDDTVTLVEDGVVCDEGVSATTAGPLELLVTAQALPGRCPDEPPVALTCDVPLTDGEREVEVSVPLLVAAVDEVPPEPGALLLSPATALAGEEVSVSAAPADDCGVALVTLEVRLPGDDVPVLSEELTAPWTFSFPAPPPLGDGPTDYEVTVTVVDVGGNEASVSEVLEVRRPSLVVPVFPVFPVFPVGPDAPTDPSDPSDPADVIDDTPVTLTFAPAALRDLSPGELAVVEGELAVEGPTTLPELRLLLAAGGLAAVPETFEALAPDCGATGALVATGVGDSVLQADGVRAGCPLRFSVVVRRGLTDAPLVVERCTFGPDERPLAACSGELSLERPRALGCGAAGASPSLLLLLLALLLSRGRVRP